MTPEWARDPSQAARTSVVPSAGSFRTTWGDTHSFLVELPKPTGWQRKVAGGLLATRGGPCPRAERHAGLRDADSEPAECRSARIQHTDVTLMGFSVTCNCKHLDRHSFGPTSSPPASLSKTAILSLFLPRQTCQVTCPFATLSHSGCDSSNPTPIPLLKKESPGGSGRDPLEG